jgi:hypothetical protein
LSRCSSRRRARRAPALRAAVSSEIRASDVWKPSDVWNRRWRDVEIGHKDRITRRRGKAVDPERLEMRRD